MSHDVSPESDRNLSLDPEVIHARLRPQQSLLFANVGGAAAAMICGIIWAFIAINTAHQIGYIGLGVGLIVGFSVRVLGAGIDTPFGVIGAVWAVLGCALGRIFTLIHHISDNLALGYFEVIPLMKTDAARDVFTSPLNLLFFLLAGYIGYRFSFRDVSDNDIIRVAKGESVQPPYLYLRKPAAMLLLAALATSGYLIYKGRNATLTNYYDSGSKKSSGLISHGNQEGAWKTWYENGKLQSAGFYKRARLDSTWNYFTEKGKLYRIDHYKDGQMHGTSLALYPDSSLLSSTQYRNGKQHGPYVIYYPTGRVRQKGQFKDGAAEGVWEDFFENGQMSSRGEFVSNTPSGLWTYWRENGNKSQESVYEADGTFKLINTWDNDNKPVIVNGTGTFQIVGEGFLILEGGSVRDGIRVGRWMKRFKDGSNKEQGDYRDKKYFIVNSWTPDHKPMVVNGAGTHQIFSDDGKVSEKGPVVNGLRHGKWKIFFNGIDASMEEINYQQGVAQGISKGYYNNGNVAYEGSLTDGKRHGEWIWYDQEGHISSRVNFIAGNKQGRQQYFNQHGALIRWEEYNKNEVILKSE